MKMSRKLTLRVAWMVLLVVVLASAVLFIRKPAGHKRGNATTRALEAALTSYFKEYKRWPTELAIANGLSISNDAPGGAVFVIPGPQNWMIFDMLRYITNSAVATAAPMACNPKNIRFLDDNKYQVLSDDKCVTRSQIPNDLETEGLIEAGHPLVYQGADGTIHYFTIIFEMDTDKVNVEL